MVGLTVVGAGCFEDTTAPIAEPDGIEPAATAVLASPPAVPGTDPRLSLLGERLFFDENLSINRNQSCGSCHDPEWGFTLPLSSVNAAGATAPGSFTDRFGDRKPPSNAYASPSPILNLQGTRFVGGVFWDGRATGEELGTPVADQALAPFLNSVEQALRDPACVAHRVAQSDYAGLYRSVYGHNLFEIEYPYDVEEACAQEGGHLDMPEGMREKVEAEYDNIALAIAAFQSSPRVNQFSSKFDGSQTGWLGAGLTEQEQLGFELFTGAASCGFCHRATGDRPLFTDFRYNNIGVPINPENPALLADPGFRDPGLGGFLETQPEWAALAEANRGLVKTPTVRNVDRRPFPGAVKAFMHNGYFKTLEQVVNFYNTRDVKPECPNPLTPADEAMAQGCWPAPEVAANENQFIGDLGLTAEEEAAIVAFLKTLNDGYLPPAVAAN